MIVQVTTEHGEKFYIGVPALAKERVSDADRKIAFRYVYKRREKDYNELAHHTLRIDVDELEPAAAEIMLSHLS